MTFWGWLIMILSVGTVTALFAWCIWQVLCVPGEADRLHGVEIETPDEKAEREQRKNRET